MTVLTVLYKTVIRLLPVSFGLCIKLSKPGFTDGFNEERPVFSGLRDFPDIFDLHSAVRNNDSSRHFLAVIDSSD